MREAGRAAITSRTMIAMRVGANPPSTLKARVAPAVLRGMTEVLRLRHLLHRRRRCSSHSIRTVTELFRPKKSRTLPRLYGLSTEIMTESFAARSCARRVLSARHRAAVAQGSAVRLAALEMGMRTRLRLLHVVSAAGAVRDTDDRPAPMARLLGLQVESMVSSAIARCRHLHPGCAVLARVARMTNRRDVRRCHRRRLVLDLSSTR